MKHQEKTTRQLTGWPCSTPKEVVNWTGLAIVAGSLTSLVLLTVGILAYVGPVAFTLLDGMAAEAAVEETVAVSAPVAAVGLVKRHQQETLSTDLFGAVSSLRYNPPHLPASRFVPQLLRWTNMLLDIVQYAKLDSDITMLHSKLKTVLFIHLNALLESPISSDHGISRLFQNGTYLAPNPNKEVVQKGARDVAQLTVISELFKALVSGFRLSSLSSRRDMMVPALTALRYGFMLLFLPQKIFVLLGQVHSF